MRNIPGSVRILTALALSSACLAVWAQSTVNFGRITAVKPVSVQNQGATTAGTVVGGVLGLASGSGQSSSNRALRGVGGAAAGNMITQAASSRQAFEYTILFDGKQTITMVTDESGLRVGDCVSVERGQFNNLRLARDSQCAPKVRPTPAEVKEADACVAAKQQLLAAETADAFDRAERRVRLLCAD